MAQILQILKDQDYSKVLKLNLMKSFETNVVEKSSIQDGLDLIEIIPTIEIIVLSEKIDDFSKLDALLAYIEKKSLNISFIVIGDKKIDYSKVFYVDNDSSWKIVIDIVSNLFGKKPNKDFYHSENSYVPVPVSYFLNINETTLGCDVFIRVKKSENEFQYIKRLSSNDFFTRSEIEKYVAQGLRDFYIGKEHFARFADFATEQLTAKLKNNANPQGQIKFQSEVFEVTKDRIASLGIDERTIGLVNESVQAIERSLGDKNALSDYLTSMRNNALSYSYAHSYLTCLLLNKILKNFEWDSSAMREKITYICYFHDISLKEDQWTKINSQEELESAHCSREVAHNIATHANRSAEIVDQFPQIPLGVSSLIREHLGVKSGVGFPVSYSIALSPISMMFIVVEDFVHHFLIYPLPPTKDQLGKIFDELDEKFTKTTYAQTVNALKNSILSNK